MIEYHIAPNPLTREKMEALVPRMRQGDYTLEDWSDLVLAAVLFEEQVNDDPAVAAAFEVIKRIDRLTRIDADCRASALSKALNLSKQDQNKHIRDYCLAGLVGAFMQQHSVAVDTAVGSNESAPSTIRNLLDQHHLPSYSPSLLKRAYRKHGAKAAQQDKPLKYWLDRLMPVKRPPRRSRNK